MITKEECLELKNRYNEGYRWIARDKNGDLYAFKTLPTKFKFFWSIKRGSPYPRLVGEREENILTCVTWEDEKPTKIDDLIQDYESHQVIVGENVKVVIPQFVADWIEECKERYTLRRLFSTTYMPHSVKDWTDCDNENCELMAKAWIFGYVVEKEELYTVRLANGDCLCRIPSKGLTWILTHVDYKNDKNYQLTQSEIESIDPILMQLAKEVE